MWFAKHTDHYVLIRFTPCIIVVESIISKVDNKEKRVSNALYAPYNMFASSNVTSRVAHVTSPRG